MDGESFKLSFKDRTRESLTLGVYNCGAQKCTPLDAWGEGVRDHYLIHYVVAGRGFYRVGGKTWALLAGDLFLVYPGTPVKYWADETDPWEYEWVGFQGGEAQYLLRQTGFSKEKVVLHCPDSHIREALSAILEARGGGLSSQTRMIGRLYEFLALLLENTGAPAHLSGGFDYVGSASKYIAYNYWAPIDVNAIAQNVGVSRSHLYRVFIKAMGVTPNEYLTRYRISQACELLREGKLSVGGVASSVGYSDPLYFSRVFRRVLGLSPREYAAKASGTPNLNEK